MAEHKQRVEINRKSFIEDETTVFGQAMIEKNLRTQQRVQEAIENDIMDASLKKGNSR